MTRFKWSKQNACLPILGKDIPNFKHWVLWNGFSRGHQGFDFAAYLTADNKCILGLSAETPVRAVADGTVFQVQEQSHGLAYAAFINIEHGETGSGMLSSYDHVMPLVKCNEKVKKGQIIAKLYKDKGNTYGRLVHLHFTMANGFGVTPSTMFEALLLNPLVVFPELSRYKCVPQGKARFNISGIRTPVEIVKTNFDKLDIESGPGRIRTADLSIISRTL